MPKRVAPSAQAEMDVLIACARRCCLCYYLLGDRRVRRGQIAHLNRNASDSRTENLAFLCFDHHDEFDSSTRQSKGFTPAEVRAYRDRLVDEVRSSGIFDDPETVKAVSSESAAQQNRRHPWKHPWRFPLWLVADQPVLFAYSAPAADGVCAIERIDLPDGRIVIACIQVPGNPGNSITNCAEYVLAQVCERFEIDPRHVVWLENYEFFDRNEWRLVEFEFDDDGVPDNPTWEVMTAAMWLSLWLSPKKRLVASGAGEYRSKLKKHFDWPPKEMALGLD